MKKTLHIVVAMIAFGSVAGSAQQARVRPLPEQIPSISMRPTGSSLGTIRVGAADKNIWFDWRVGVPGDGDQVADALGDAAEGRRAQRRERRSVEHPDRQPGDSEET